MYAVLSDFSETALARANEANMEGCCALLRSLPEAECYDGEEMLRICTGVPFFFLNVILRTRLSHETLENWIEPTLDYFRSRKLPMSWVVSPSTQPPDLETRLQAHGLVPLLCMPGMAIDLESLPQALTLPSEVTLKEVADTEMLEQWTHTVSVGSAVPRNIMDVFASVSCTQGYLEQASLRNFVAYVKGEPVGASSLFMDSGVAGIYCVAVLPEARRQGIGAAITAAPLRLARGLGYRIGTLQASEMGEPVYRRLGFQECCRINLYGFADPG